MGCPKTAPEIINQLCSLHYLPSETGHCCKYFKVCNQHFERWMKEEPEVQRIHNEWLRLSNPEYLNKKENENMEAREIIEKMEKGDRLLSESAVMKAVQKALIEMGYEPLDDRVMGVYKAIENTPTANDWIPCSERLPEDDTEVLVQYDNNNDNHSMGLAFYQRNFGWEGEDFQHYEYRLNVVAWQPLPAPYVQS